MQKKDKFFARMFIVGMVLIITYWGYEGVLWVWNWYLGSGGFTSEWWWNFGGFLWRNISIVVVIYGIICLQVSGLAELKSGKNFLKAFVLALILTPLGMMIVYGHKKS